MADIAANIGTTATLNLLDDSGSFSGGIETPNDHDWIRVDLVDGRAYNFFLSFLETDVFVVGDSQLTLRDQAGNPLAGAGPGSGVGGNAMLSFTPAISGTYYLDVSGPAQTTGEYSLAVTLDVVIANEQLLTSGPDSATGAFGDSLIGGPSADHLDIGDGISALGEQGNDIIKGNVVANYAWGGIGHDSIFGEAGDDLLFGDSGDDRIEGGLDNDDIFGGAGNDALFGGSGSDFISGGPGADFMVGGADNDTFVIAGSEGLDDIFDGGLGDDSLKVEGSGPAVLSGFNSFTSSIEVWNGNGAGLFGTAEANGFNFSTLTLKNGLPFVDGRGGGDLIIGSNFSDDLRGASGRDTLHGRDGNDVLTGGQHRDVLTGGAGGDLFDFNSIKESKKGGANRDMITDFQRGQDDIDLRGIDAKSGGGNQAFKFIGKQDFHDRKGELRYEDKGSKVIVQGDVNGDGKADFEIFVKVGALSAGDFLL